MSRHSYDSRHGTHMCDVTRVYMSRYSYDSHHIAVDIIWYSRATLPGRDVLQCHSACCSVLQCVAACCSVLQCRATHMIHTTHIHTSHVTHMSTVTNASPVTLTSHATHRCVLQPSTGRRRVSPIRRSKIPQKSAPESFYTVH